MYFKDIKMKKLFIIIFILFISLPIISNSVFAQESALTNDTQYFEISLQRDGQSALNKAVTYTVYVTPKIDSARTQIIWDAPTLITISPKHKEFVDMYRGETYSFKATFKPQREGSYEVSVNLIAWQHDTNYTNSVSDIMNFNKDLIIQPIEPSYVYGNIAKILFITLFCGLAIFGFIKLSKKGVKAFKKWITPPL